MIDKELCDKLCHARADAIAGNDLVQAELIHDIVLAIGNSSVSEVMGTLLLVQSLMNGR